MIVTRVYEHCTNTVMSELYNVVIEWRQQYLTWSIWWLRYHYFVIGSYLYWRTCICAYMPGSKTCNNCSMYRKQDTIRFQS